MGRVEVTHPALRFLHPGSSAAIGRDRSVLDRVSTTTCPGLGAARSVQDPSDAGTDGTDRGRWGVDRAFDRGWCARQKCLPPSQFLGLRSALQGGKTATDSSPPESPKQSTIDAPTHTPPVEDGWRTHNTSAHLALGIDRSIELRKPRTRRRTTTLNSLFPTNGTAYDARLVVLAQSTE